MKDVLENAIKTLANKAEKTISATEAMQLSQAALNLANTRATLQNIKEDTAG